MLSLRSCGEPQKTEVDERKMKRHRPFLKVISRGGCFSVSKALMKKRLKATAKSKNEVLKFDKGKAKDWINCMEPRARSILYVARRASSAKKPPSWWTKLLAEEGSSDGSQSPNRRHKRKKPAKRLCKPVISSIFSSSFVSWVLFSRKCFEYI